jgi:signal transduction histidine kinase
MKTALLVTNSTETQRLLGDMFGHDVNFILATPPAEANRHNYDEMYSSWLRLADAVILDAISLGEATRWAVESLEAATHAMPVAVAVLATPLQVNVHPMSEQWLIVTDTHSVESLSKSLRTFFDLHDAKSKLQRTEAILARQRRQTSRTGPAGGPAGTGGGASNDWVRYRDALKNMSRLMTEFRMGGDPDSLLTQFARMVRELMGVGKLAVFLRRFQNDAITGKPSPVGSDLSAVVCEGIGSKVIEHVRLSCGTGVGGFLSHHACILRRELMSDPSTVEYDPQIAREFQLLGTEVAVPMFDNDQLIGVLTLSGRITGEPLGNEDLELLWYMMDQLGDALRNLRLLEQMTVQQRFMSDLLAHVQSGVVTVGRGGRILSMNKRACELLDVGSQDLIGQSIGRLPSPVASVIFEALQTGREISDREVNMPRGGRPLSVSANRFVARLEAGDSDKTNLVAVGLIDDLTQRRLQGAHDRVKADQEFFVRLASRLSHELKNSLVSIKIFSQLLPARYSEKEFREQFSSTVVNEVNRIDVLVNNLTFFAHPLQVVCEPLVLTDLIDTCVTNISQEFARKQVAHVLLYGEKPPEDGSNLPVIAIKRSIGHKVARLDGDKIRLMQAIEHVMRNAVQSLAVVNHDRTLVIVTAEATPEDFPDGKLPVGGAVKIEFRDNAEGIPLENLKRVTEPFMTTRNVGVGLGLTIVKKIVERHGGVLTIDSMLGKGTTVTLTMPVQSPPAPETNANGQTSAPQSVSPAGGSADEDGSRPRWQNRIDDKQTRRGQT